MRVDSPRHSYSKMLPMKNYFELLEFYDLEALNTPEFHDRNVLSKIEAWVDKLNPIRDMLGFPISITNAYRIGDGTSQHYFKGDGAVDLRPFNTKESSQMARLGMALACSGRITRVCYYPKGDLFPFAGFHIDRKTEYKCLFVSQPNKVDWQPTTLKQFTDALHAKG